MDGLKKLALNRKHKNKTKIARDTDGAFRLHNRLDGYTAEEVVAAADGTRELTKSKKPFEIG